MSDKALVFVDAIGGGLAAIGAGVAQSLGVAHAIAATSADTIDVPKEVSVVLGEIGAEAPKVHGADAIAKEGAELVFLGGSSASAWSVALHGGEGDLERLSSARIARDRIERELSKR